MEKELSTAMTRKDTPVMPTDARDEAEKLAAVFAKDTRTVYTVERGEGFTRGRVEIWASGGSVSYSCSIHGQSLERCTCIGGEYRGPFTDALDRHRRLEARVEFLEGLLAKVSDIAALRLALRNLSCERERFTPDEWAELERLADG